MDQTLSRLETALDLHTRLNRIRSLIVREIRHRGGKDLAELLAAERELAVQFEHANVQAEA